MLITKKNRLVILSYLFKEGVICAKKDYMSMKDLSGEADEEEVKVPNLEASRSLHRLHRLHPDAPGGAAPAAGHPIDQPGRTRAHRAVGIVRRPALTRGLARRL